MNQPLIAVIAVCCNVGAQLAMKYAGRGNVSADSLAFWLAPGLIGAVVLYGLSFLLTIKVFAANPLSVASPIMAGGTFFLIAMASSVVLGETMGIQKVAGIAVIFIGIVLLMRA